MKFVKQMIVVIWVFLGVMMVSPTFVTGDEQKKDGKELYKEDCRVCHQVDSPNGEFSPMSLTQNQWKRFFKDKFTDKHKEVILQRENKELLEYLTEENLKKIQKYCVDHAADSEQPQTCSE